MFRTIFLLLFSWAFSVFSTNVKIPIDEPITNNSAFTSANYICDNLHLLNEYAYENGFTTNISSCKTQEILIKTLDEEEKGVYIDFNDDNGYLAIGENQIIYDIALEGKSIIEDNYKNNLGTLLGAFVVEK